MDLDSPVASEADSLAEEKLKEKDIEDHNFDRDNRNYSTFTRHRPTNLHRNKARGHRQSLLSPQSVDNLDAGDAETPDFAMTQSMYEPTGKKEQIEKLNQQCKLMNLIASEKAAQAAQKRKMKEMKQKVSEQKKRNEERQRIVEERRIRMVAEEEEKRKRILSKIGKSNTMTSSVMTQSILVKTKNGSNSKFLANRPLSSTGKVFGFGSSTPRHTCNPIKQEKVHHNNQYPMDLGRDNMPISRMCASQIMHQSSYNEIKLRPEKNQSSKISKSTFNVSEIHKLQIRNERGPPSNTNDLIKIQKSTPRTIKNIHPIQRSESSHRKSTEDNPRTCTPIKEATTPTKVQRMPSEKHVVSVKQKVPKSPVGTEKKSILRSDMNKINLKNENHVPESNKRDISLNRRSIKLESDERYDQDSDKKPEVRFVTGSEDSSKINKENSDQIPEKRTSIIKEISDEEYKQRMALQRKLAREKKLREEMEKKAMEEKEASKALIEPMSPIDMSTTTESEISINILPNDELQKETSIIQPSLPTEPLKEEKEEIKVKEVVSIPNIEISKEKEELTASTDELDRLARKKRLESIMSRVKKLPSGSSENVSHQMTSSALQNMMEKGHLTGMSKTAAVLMKNAHRSSVFTSSTLDIQGSTETVRTSISMENLQNGDDHDALVSRGDCDGKEDSQKENDPRQEHKSNVMPNLNSATDGAHLLAWKDKYSTNDSLDSEAVNTEQI